MLWDKFKPESTTETENNGSDEKITLSKPVTSFNVSGNGSRSANKHYRDTTVVRKDSARVMNAAINRSQKRTENFNKKYGTNF